MERKKRYACWCRNNDTYYYVVCTPGLDDPSDIPVKVLLQDHLDDVANKAGIYSALLNLPEDLRSAEMNSGGWHDWGKAGRFQKYLKGSSLDEDAVAKPLNPMRGWREVVRRQKEAGLPPNFRHEWVSCLFFEKYCERPTDPDELILWKLKRHLILTHHGYFAPMPRVVIEKEGSISLRGGLARERLSMKLRLRVLELITTTCKATLSFSGYLGTGGSATWKLFFEHQIGSSRQRGARNKDYDKVNRPLRGQLSWIFSRTWSTEVGELSPPKRHSSLGRVRRTGNCLRRGSASKFIGYSS